RKPPAAWPSPRARPMRARTAIPRWASRQAAASNMRWVRNGRSAEFLYYNLSFTHVAGTAQFFVPPGFSTAEPDFTFAFRGYPLRLGVNYECDGSGGGEPGPTQDP